MRPESTILLTGAAGFIGYHAARRLLADGHRVVGVDNLNDYYDVALKRARLADLAAAPGGERFTFAAADLSDAAALDRAVDGVTFTHILHLAAQAGVRYSLDNPRAYVESNVMGHLNVLELARARGTVEHLVYASSSSVYGEREGGPFHESDRVRSPASLYAATKLGGEMMAQSYAALYGIAQTGLRFFTVYGRFGRPDMAYFIFTDKIMRGEPITLFAPDEMRRDFTHVSDIVGALPTILASPPAGEPADRHRVYNLGNGRPVSLLDFVGAIEVACGRKADTRILPRQKGDVSTTYADISAAARDFGYSPQTTLATGIPDFVDWFRRYPGYPA